jgi:outer membrane protein OmpA-like peptidoglycan-associated protein
MKTLGLLLLWSLSLTLSAQLLSEKPVVRTGGEAVFAPGFIDTTLVYCANRNEAIFRSFTDTYGEYRTRWYSDDGSGRLKAFQPEFTQPFYHLGPFSWSSARQELCFTASRFLRSGEKAVLELYIVNKNPDGTWSDAEPFELNSKQLTRNIGHPAFSVTGDTLYYVVSDDDQPSELYYVTRRNKQKWNDPQRLELPDSKESNEYYPHLASDGWLYFSSDRIDSLGFDLYRFDPHSSRIEHLPKPYSSAANDYALFRNLASRTELITTDRNDREMAVYRIERTIPEFTNCSDVLPLANCYYFEEQQINSELPLRYTWHFGDGQSQQGAAVEHCYADYGLFDVYLELTDTLTGEDYGIISQLQVQVSPSGLPMVEGPDTLVINQTKKYQITHKEVKGRPTEWYWSIDGEWIEGGAQTGLSFSSTGEHEVIAGIVVNGRAICNRRTIQVVANPPEIVADADKLGIERPLKVKRKDDLVYYVEFFNSDWEISLSDPLFADVPFEITERLTDDRYAYSVGKSDSPYALYETYKTMKSLGFDESLVKEEKIRVFRDAIVREGGYVYDQEKQEMLAFVKSLADINFEVNSSVITKASYSNLQEVRNILLIDEGLRLFITAHTDNSGSSDYNQQLSEDRAKAVFNYLVDQGIESSRIRTKGFGDKRPIADNGTEAGRSKNRRVEFRLFFAE